MCILLLNSVSQQVWLHNMPVNSDNAREHADRLKELIKKTVSESMFEAGVAMLKVAADRAPSVDEEYNELNAESGGTALVPRSGDTSSDTDGRTRFIKPEVSYLKNAIPNTSNMRVLKSRVRVGNLTFLNNVTKFKYRNLGAGGGTIENTVGPYFQMFEGGTAGAAVEGGITTFTVVPRKDSYPLRPGEGPDGVRKTMIKSIRGRAMFSPLVLGKAASAVIKKALAEIGPSKED